MKRRDITTAVGSLVLFAGCTGSNEPNSSGQRITTTSNTADLQIERLEVEPEELEIEDSFSLSIELTDYGAQKGQGEVWYAIQESETSFTNIEEDSFLVDVESGKTKTYSESYSLDYVGDFYAVINSESTKGARNTDHSTEISVRPKELDIEDSFTTRNEYTISITETFFRQSYQSRDSFSGDVETVSPENEDLFAFVRVRVGNEGTGEGSVPIPDDFFARVNGTAYELAINPLSNRPEFRGELEDIQLFTSGEIPIDAAREGYLVFEVPSAAREAFQVGWQSRHTRKQVVYWSD
jgi:hypothetical protein